MQPLLIPANVIPTFYRGGGKIPAFRRDPSVDAGRPEDWVASVTARFGDAPNGLSTLPDGRTLADAVAADPQGWTGRPDADTTGLLVKLLDAGQRLPLHLHPSRSFAHEHLSDPHGKTEAWIIVDADPGAVVNFGFAQDVSAEQLDDWVQRQDVEAMLAATNEIPVAAGDVWLCPAGVPHAIGAGILCVELQEPTDFSIMLEWRDLPLDPDSVFLGLDRDLALQAVRREAVTPAELEQWRGQALSALPSGVPGGRRSLLPTAADEFFRAEQLTPAGSALTLDPRFAVLVVDQGSGGLVLPDGTALELTAGQTWVVPHAAGTLEVTGDVSVIRCTAG
ncbi:class I mannose-6-phosphate isomerase [Nakamurella leprariae]|uniref:Class I mannose-6-phosphate isomerase n=1 Tax=Nakamurella leprariae TaxID=2803911 RepID=A0A938YK74_9ACTN|nr:class I mannose-6-phosphate isomerase [Nakamurella leprariae]MBM9469383.1 class I mannose-6-phosphate isomerase [Nakamurella leprariae]